MKDVMKKLYLSLCVSVNMFATYYSQCNQDQFLNEIVFKNKKNGVFVDIGAHNGVTFSNSYFFENELDWTGLCVEANPTVFDDLKKSRKSTCINCCIVPFEKMDLHFLKISGYPNMLSGIYEFYDPRHLTRIQNELNQFGGSCELISLPSATVNDLLQKYSISTVDFLSLDIEGGELDILKSIDYKTFDIKAITVENAYSDKNFEVFMKSRGYILFKNLGHDQLFIKNEFILESEELRKHLILSENR